MNTVRKLESMLGYELDEETIRSKSKLLWIALRDNFTEENRDCFDNILQNTDTKTIGIILLLLEKYIQDGVKADNMSSRICNLERDIQKASEDLLCSATSNNCEEMKVLAMRLMGVEFCTKFDLLHNFPLNDEERDYAIKVLTSQHKEIK